MRDDNPEPPVVREARARTVGGLGMQFVARLADAWGVEQHPGDGKTIWFRVTTAAT